MCNICCTLIFFILESFTMNTKQPYKILETEQGVKISRWFSRKYPGMPTREFYKLCRGGQIRLNSSRVKTGNEILRTDDLIRIPPTLEKYKTPVQKKTESGNRFSMSDLESLRKCIIYDDEDLVVFNKPAGLAVQGGSGIQKSIDKMAAALFPYSKVSLVHRLDKETSGLLVVAKSQLAAQILSRDFQNKNVSKLYMALLSGRVNPKYGTIDNMIQKGKILGEDEKMAAGEKYQRAITDYKVISEVPNVLSWVEFSPKTGRTHQLRMHSALTLGAPIVGDDLYGREQKFDSALDSLLTTNNLFLFAYKLSFKHPKTGKIVVIKAEMPDFMTSVIKFLEFKTDF